MSIAPRLHCFWTLLRTVLPPFPWAAKPDHPSSEAICPSSQSKPPLAQCVGFSSCPVPCYLGEDQPSRGYSLLSDFYHICKKELHFHVDGTECLGSHGRIKGMELVESSAVPSVPRASSPLLPGGHGWNKLPWSSLKANCHSLLLHWCSKLTLHTGNRVKYFRSPPNSFEAQREGTIWL